MIILTKEIPYRYTTKPITIIPMFDIHYGSRMCDVAALKHDLDTMDWENTYMFGGGDWLDSIITHDMKRYRKSSDDTKGDDIIDEQISRIYDIIAPHREKLIGIGVGNHEDTITIRCATNPMKRLAGMLNVPFLGYSSLIRLKFQRKKASTRTVVIRCHHGWGGGSRTQGADLTKYTRDVGYWDADVFCYGHVHRRQSDKYPRLGLVGERLISKPKIIMICGTYLKTFTMDENPSYSEKEGYPPTEIGCLRLEILPQISNWVKMSVID